MKTIGIACLIALMLPSQVVAWGQEGHSIIAEIAQRRLDAGALAKIQGLLASETPSVSNPVASLSSIASWADDYRASHSDTAGWHFVNIPDDRSTYDPDADCKNGACAVDAIARFKSIAMVRPKPRHSGQAPRGLLKLKSPGLGGRMSRSQCAQCQPVENGNS